MQIVSLSDNKDKMSNLISENDMSNPIFWEK